VSQLRDPEFNRLLLAGELVVLLEIGERRSRLIEIKITQHPAMFRAVVSQVGMYDARSRSSAASRLVK